MIAGAYNSPTEMRHSQSQESNRTTIGGSNSTEHSGTGNNQQTGALEIQAQIAGIAVAKKHKVEALDQGKRQ